MNLRAVIALGLVVAVVAAVVALNRAGPAVGPQPHVPSASTTSPANGGPATSTTGARTVPFLTADDCRACHEDLWAEWKTSFHGQAWTDPMVQALSQGFRMPECIDCHAPLPIQVTGVGQRVAPRKNARGDGVDCISCHLMEDGVSVAALRATETSATPGACRPVVVPEMGKVDACASCHNQHETVDELLKSGLDKVCLDCHMEPVVRKGKAGRSHRFPGGHDLAMLQRATKLEATFENGEIVVRVTNVGAGHQIPTDARHRSFNLWITAIDARGNPWVSDQPIPEGEMRLYYRDQFKPSTQVPYQKQHVAKWRVPDGLKGKAIVKLTYALNPEELGAGRITTVWTVEVTIR